MHEQRKRGKERENIISYKITIHICYTAYCISEHIPYHICINSRKTKLYHLVVLDINIL